MALKTFLTYVPKDSKINKIHPVVKVSLLLTINIIAWLIEDPIILFLLFLLIVFSYKIFRVPLYGLKKFLLSTIIILQAIIISYVFGSKIPGKNIYLIFPWGTYVSEMTIVYIIAMSFRFTSMLLGSTLMLGTMRDRDIIYGVTCLHFPYSLAFIINLSFRNMGIFIEDYSRVRDAMVLRGGKLSKGSFLERIKNYIYLATPLAILAVRRIIEISYAVEAKGFGINKKRSYYHDYYINLKNLILTILILSLIPLTFIGKTYFKIFVFPGVINIFIK
ncbi:MAG: energy-coupling factor transporter transmembrane component T [Candidatus Aenigmatarchaeota archaeon]